MSRGFIYRISAANSNKVYVGQSVNPVRRWSAHRSLARLGKHANPHLGRFINKHDCLFFYWPVEDMCAEEARYAAEQKESGFDLINLIPCGDATPCLLGDRNGFFGKKHTTETKEHLSKLAQGRVNPMQGKQHSSATRALISVRSGASRLGRRRGPYKGRTEYGSAWRKKINEGANLGVGSAA